jgi:competence protein ComEC
MAASENDNSLVIEVVFAGRRLLLPGDLEAGGEASLLRRLRAQLGADVLKVPHHGSRTSSSAAFLEAVHPVVAVFSVGDHNRWGFPHPEVLARYQACGASLLRTDLDGAVTVRISAAGEVVARTTAHRRDSRSSAIAGR